MPTFFDALNDLMAAEVPLVTVTIVDTVGSVPQDRGAKAIVTADGLVYGTVGGGKVETKAIAEAQRMLRGEIDDNTHFAQWNLQKDVGMTCGGVVKLYFESHNVGRWQIWVFGAGHTANALINLLVHLDCHVTCVDPRAEWLDKLPASHKLTKVQNAEMPSVVEPGKSMRVLFYADIISRTREQYRALWDNLRMDNLCTELADQLYVLSLINRQKYTALAKLYFGLGAMTVMLAIVIGTLGLYKVTG